MAQNKKKPKYSLRGLNSQLFFFVILPISLLLIAITFGSFGLHQNAMRDLVAARDQRTVNSSARAMAEHIKHRKSVIQSIGFRSIDDFSLIDFFQSVEFLSEDFDVGIAVYDPSGELLGFSKDPKEWIDSEADIQGHLENLNNVIQTSPQVSDPFYSEDHGEYLSFVIFQDNPKAFVFVGVFSVTKLARENLSGTISSDNVGSVFLVDQNRNLIYKTGTQVVPGDHATIPGVDEALNGETGTIYLDADDGEHVIVYTPISETGWALVIEEPWREITSPLLRYSETGSLILLPIVIFGLIAVWFGTVKIIQPLNTFQRQAELFIEGDFQAFNDPVGGIEEIQTLQETFVAMAEEIEDAQRILTRYLNIVTKGQEDERKRLARELHDDTLQSLIALNQRIMMARRHSDAAELRGTLTEIESMLGKTMQELRRLTRALRPIYLEDLGLVSAIESLSVELSESYGIPINFTIEGTERRLPDNVEIALYRIVQEALSNINKHAQASRAEIDIVYQETELLLRIEDNGRGFNPPRNPRELSKIGHYGLLGIHERVDLINAEYDFQSELDKGTILSVRVPY